MRIELLIGGFAILIGILASILSRQTTELIVAGNYVIGSHRGSVANATQRPWVTRLIGIVFVIVGAVLVVYGVDDAPGPRPAPAEQWELILPLVSSGVLGAFGLGVLASRRRLTALAAERLKVNGAEIYEGDQAERSARMIVLTFGIWIFVVSALISAAGVIFYLRA